MPKRVPVCPGDVFGRLTVLAEAPHTTKQRYRWICRCTCGQTATVLGYGLHSGNTRSCGCLHRELLSARARVHGEAGRDTTQRTPEYRLWAAIKSRCAPADKSGYYARGIRMHPPWARSFPEFAAYLRNVLGPKPTPQHTLDRADNARGYEPGNLRWATRAEQSLNSTRVHLITANSVTDSVSGWARRLNTRPHVIYLRLRRGWTVEAAVLTPLRDTRPAHGAVAST